MIRSSLFWNVNKMEKFLEEFCEWDINLVTPFMKTYLSYDINTFFGVIRAPGTRAFLSNSNGVTRRPPLHCHSYRQRSKKSVRPLLKLNFTKCLEEDSPHPRSSALSSPTSSARRRRPAPSSWSSSGPTSRRTTSRWDTKHYRTLMGWSPLTFVYPLPHPGPRQQAVLRPRQEDGQGLRLREDARLRHGQAHRPPPILRSIGQRFTPHFYTTSTKINKNMKTIKYLVSLLRS